MTAICGFLAFTDDIVPAVACVRMAAAMQRYGQDGTSDWSDEAAALCRLFMQIVPQDARDGQPLTVSNGRYVVIADARLANRKELATALALDQAEMSDLSDGQLVAKAFERWRENCFARLYGPTAIAVYDRCDRRLILARDPMAQRPLFFHRNERFCAFASVPDGLHALPQIPRGADEDFIAAVLSFTVPTASTHSYYRGIERVLPGHYCAISAHGMQITRFWNPDTAPLILKDHREYIDGLRHHLDAAVARTLQGVDGDVAAQLSGGLDSSAVAATAARFLSNRGKRVVAFTAVPRPNLPLDDAPGLVNDEGPQAAKLAARYANMVHVPVTGEGNLLDLIRGCYGIYGMPIPNSCNLGWIDAIYENAQKRGLTVLLTGGRGNGAFSFDGGTFLSEMVASGHLLKLVQTARTLRCLGRGGYRKILKAAIAPWIPVPLWLRMERENGKIDDETYSPLSKPLYDRLNRSARSGSTLFDLWGRPPQKRIKFMLDSFLDARSESALMDKGALGRWKVETRDPTADREMIEYLLRVPTDQYCYGYLGRALCRHAIEDRVPKEIAYNPKRGLQGADWFVEVSRLRSEIAAEVEKIAAFEPTRTLFDVPRLRNLVEHWPIEWQSEKVYVDYCRVLLSAVAYADFIRRAYGAN